MGDASWWLGFSGKKPFYHGLHPVTPPNPGKLLIFRRLGHQAFRFWGNSCLVEQWTDLSIEHSRLTMLVAEPKAT